MAWNPSPEVAIARDYGKKFNKTKVIILSIDERQETFEVVSYGETKQKCAEAKKIADSLYSLICKRVLEISD